MKLAGTLVPHSSNYPQWDKAVWTHRSRTCRGSEAQKKKKKKKNASTKERVHSPKFPTMHLLPLLADRFKWLALRAHFTRQHFTCIYRHEISFEGLSVGGGHLHALDGSPILWICIDISWRSNDYKRLKTTFLGTIHSHATTINPFNHHTRFHPKAPCRGQQFGLSRRTCSRNRPLQRWKRRCNQTTYRHKGGSCTTINQLGNQNTKNVEQVSKLKKGSFRSYAVIEVKGYIWAEMICPPWASWAWL